jgi:hypothetical protein
MSIHGAKGKFHFAATQAAARHTAAVATIAAKPATMAAPTGKATPPPRPPPPTKGGASSLAAKVELEPVVRTNKVDEEQGLGQLTALSAFKSEDDPSFSFPKAAVLTLL